MNSLANGTVRFEDSVRNDGTFADESRLISLAPVDPFFPSNVSLNSAQEHAINDHTLINSSSPLIHDGSELNKTNVIKAIMEQNRILTERVNYIHHWRSQTSLGSVGNNVSYKRGMGDCCYSCAEKENKIQDLSKTLGKTECEMQELHQFISQMKQDTTVERHKSHQTVEELRSLLLSLESQVQELSEKNRSLLKEGEKFKAYKATLPTKADHTKLKHELDVEKDKKERLKEKLISTNKQLVSSRAVEKANQVLLAERSKEIEDLRAELAKNVENVRILENFCRADANNSFYDENSELPHVVIANLKREVSELTAELTKYKKLGKTQRAALKAENTRHEKETAELKTEMNTANEQIEQLIAQLKELKLEYKLLKTSFEEVTQDNVFLKQENENLVSENQELKSLELSEKYKTNKVVAKQLENCHRQMREIFSILDKFKSNSDVDLSFIIGAAEHHFENEAVKSTVPIGERVNELQRDLKIFREEINDKAASVVGSDCQIQ